MFHFREHLPCGQSCPHLADDLVIVFGKLAHNDPPFYQTYRYNAADQTFAMIFDKTRLPWNLETNGRITELFDAFKMSAEDKKQIASMKLKSVSYIPRVKTIVILSETETKKNLIHYIPIGSNGDFTETKIERQEINEDLTSLVVDHKGRLVAFYQKDLSFGIASIDDSRVHLTDERVSPSEGMVSNDLLLSVI